MSAAWRSALARRPDGAGAVLALAALVAVPVGAAVGVALRDRPPAIAGEALAPPVVLPAPAVVVEGRRAVELALTWEEPQPILSPGGEGTVTEVAVSVGDAVGSGTVLGRVDDRPVVALAGPMPLYRDLRVGDRGPDARELRGLLVALGALGPDRARGEVVDAGVMAAARRAGLAGAEASPPGPQGPAGAVTVVERARIVWVGPEPVVLGRLDLRVGAPWPAVGAQPARLARAAIEGGAGAAPGDLDELGDLEVALGEAAFPLAPDGTVASEHLEALAARLQGRPERVGAELRLVEARAGRAVPASSIVTTGGATCVLTGVEGSWAPVPVAILDTSLGRTLVAPQRELDEVLANPHQVLARPSCGS